jgi:signal transduction histidine kinase
MRGRVADLGGRLEVMSTSGRGTVLRVEVPAQR